MMQYKQALRTLPLLGVALATTLTLLIGTAAFHDSGLSLISVAHAMQAGKTATQAQRVCASHPNVQNCMNQDPVVQGCDKDATTLAFKDFTDLQDHLIALLQRRYSPTCHSEWGRILDDGKQPLQIIVNKNVRSTKGSVAYSTMVFVPNLSVAPQIEGLVSTNGIDFAAGSQGQESILPALPPAQIQ